MNIQSKYILIFFIGYVWDCSDWIPASHVPLPNITEVPGSEVSSYNSNDSNDSGTQHISGKSSLTFN